MKSKVLFDATLILSISLLLFSCGEQKTKWQGTIEEVDGVIIVRNPIEPIYAPDAIEIEKDLSIKDAPDDEGFIFQLLAMLCVDDDENIYAVDMLACHIKVFDKLGNHKFNIGRKGQGPGEFTRPFRIQYVKPNKILVLDISNYRLSWFSCNGDLKREISTSSIRPSRVESDLKGNLVVKISTMVEEGSISEIKKLDPNLNDLFKISSHINKPTPPGIFPMQDPRRQFHVSSNGFIIWGDESRYEFNIIDEDGKIVKRILKEYNPIRITESEKERLIKERFGTQGVFQERKPTFPDYYLPFSDFLINDEGMIIVRTFKRTSEGNKIYDIFDSDSKYLVSIPLNGFPQTWKKDKLYFIERDEEGYQFIARYQVTWNY